MSKNSIIDNQMEMNSIGTLRVPKLTEDQIVDFKKLWYAQDPYTSYIVRCQ